MPQTAAIAVERRDYLRPLYLGIAAAAIGEGAIFAVWGLWLFPAGDPLGKLVWVAVCSLGMGAVGGALVDLLVVGRLSGKAAIAATVVITVVVVGLGCNALCWSLDHHFGWWGGGSHPGLFLGGGAVGALGLGWLYAYLLFSAKGNRLLERCGL